MDKDALFQLNRGSQLVTRYSLKRTGRALVYGSAIGFFDRTAPRHPARSEQARQALETLDRDGAVNLGQVLDLGDVPERIAQGFDRGADQFRNVTRFYLRNPFVYAPRIADWLRNPLVNEIVESYLGASAVFDRCLVWRIPASASERKTSAVWHHDWCGRRLKLFVLLHDVTEEGRPTHYIRGSHKGQWRWMDYELSRFEDAEAESRGAEIKLTGRRGDCLLFDTNGLHRATGEGGKESRDVISLEYSDARKSGWLARHGFEIGVKREQLPPGFDQAGTLLSPRSLHRGNSQLVYGEVPHLQTEPCLDPLA
jgi:hypothetical protein